MACLGAPLAAASAQDEPALEPDAIAGLAIVITDVEGMAQVRPGENEPWERAQPGMMLAAGAAFRTGPRSAVRFRVGDTQAVTLDRLGTATVLEAIAEAGQATTDVGMQYGRTIFEIEAAEELEHDSRIRSPSATLSVRGSRGFLEEYKSKVLSGADRGDVAWFNTRGRFVRLPPGARQENEQVATAQQKIDEAAFREKRRANQDKENQLLAQFNTGFFQKRRAGLGDVRRQDFRRQQQLKGLENMGFGAGTLRFTTDWDGPADLDMYVISPLGEGVAVFPAGGIPGFEGQPAASAPSGGAAGPDDGSPNGAERITWGPLFPLGSYTVGTRVFSARGDTTTANIDALRNGQPIIPTFSGELDANGQFVQTQVELGPQDR